MAAQTRVMAGWGGRILDMRVDSQAIRVCLDEVRGESKREESETIIDASAEPCKDVGAIT